MQRLILVSAAALALAACGGADSTEETAAATGEVSVTNATAEQVAAQVQAARTRNPMQAGQWEQQLEIVSVELPGVPEGPQRTMAEQMANAGARTVNRCVTEEEANRVNLDALGGVGRNCFYHRLRIADGEIDARFTCTTPGGDTVESTMDGKLAGDEMDLTIDSSTELANTPGSIDMKLRISGRRTGDCPA